MKYLGLDYGTKRIGVAVSDETGTLAFPLEVVRSDPKALSEIHMLAVKNGVQAFVLGESRNFRNEPNAVMENIEQFKRDLEEVSAMPVHYEREFFTSAAAARQFAPEEKSRKANPSQEKLDAAAAALILQGFLDRNKK